MSVEIKVFGTEQLCASCVNLPSAKETAEWLQAALSRKYGSDSIRILYSDFQQSQTDDDKNWAERIVEEDLWYPLVVISGEIVGEGNPKLKDIYAKLESMGLRPLADLVDSES
ncbi:disulfide oxidoreductase [Brevibacillus choshinensis]|uniref:Disulfide oxidoreductase n=1 Tax=Brevibacillus choshinensis TaxID=54911 RepID=A0ABR5N642_BRECH|nr:YuzD family protein [Brevibacillus choshinensis]KQL46102.1 disulfide oxidoreductase [Brevibacillus choshinensis]